MRIYLYDVYSLLSQIHMLLNNVKNMSVINWDKKKKKGQRQINLMLKRSEGTNKRITSDRRCGPCSLSAIRKSFCPQASCYLLAEQLLTYYNIYKYLQTSLRNTDIV